MNKENRTFILCLSLVFLWAGCHMIDTAIYFGSQIALYNFIDISVIFIYAVMIMVSMSLGVLLLIYSFITD